MVLSPDSGSVSGQIAQRSDLKLTGSMFFLSILSFFLVFFQLMVGLQVDGPLSGVGACADSLGYSRGLCYAGGSGPLLGPLLAVLGRSWGLCSRSWAILGPLLAVPGRLGPTLRCYVGGLGPLLGPMLAVWATLGASVGGPGPSWV